MNRYEKASDYIITRMSKELSPKLYYHNIPHIMDVLNSAVRIAEAEKVGPEQMELLKVAVLFHDSGFIVDSVNHEDTSCEFAREYLPTIGYSKREVEVICELILATRVPHSPKNLLEEIICDADLDYLGRDDFFSTGSNIFRELMVHNVIRDERQWNEMQVKFLATHRYFTQTSILKRNAKKEEHLEKVKSLLNAEV